MEIEKSIFGKHNCNSCYQCHQWLLKLVDKDIMKNQYLYTFKIHSSQDSLNY